VGSSLLQLAKILGARAIGVVGGPHKVETARRLGAAEVIDKSSEDLWDAAKRHAPDGYHAVFDANGVATLWQSYQHMRPTGRLIVYGHHTMLPRGKGVVNWLALAWHWWRLPKFDPLRMTESNKSVMAFNLSYLFRERRTFDRAMDQIVEWIADGRLAAPPVTTYALDDVAKAHRDIETGKTVGKLVLVP
jgi:NADPH:quinone reductase-like Zn-dependent oxidoreductase